MTPAFLVVALLAVGRDDPPPPVQLTAQQDHKRLLDLLGIPQLRRGADGNPKSANAANSDESKAGT